jgi:hypothetical protein
LVSATAAGVLFLAGAGPGSHGAQTNAPPPFLGSQSCATSGCHGGAGAHQNQFLVWSTRDFHSQRPYATLTTARSRQMAEALGISDPARDTRCTTCHAPLAQVPAPWQAAPLKPTEGVSCESCHGPAENYLRAHTRPDYTAADRAVLGLRNLRHLYVRANTCIACHQTVELPLLRAGHPELIFELDGQCVSQPKHWRNDRDPPGPQAWLVGQAAALREVSWQLSRDPAATEHLLPNWQALVWLLRKGAQLEAAGDDAPAMLPAADALARTAATMPWTTAETRRWWKALTGSAADFRDTRLPQPVQARRAERLVLALERLAVALGYERAAEAEIQRLFALAQSRPDFDPAAFAFTLEALNAKTGEPTR